LFLRFHFFVHFFPLFNRSFVMTRTIRTFGFGLIALTTSQVFGAFADLSGWAGLNNVGGGNNYGLISTTSAGGTLQPRVATGGAYFADTSLVGGALTQATTFQAYGTMSFDANTSSTPPDSITVVDPVIRIGFFDTSKLNNAALTTADANQLLFADQSLTEFRVQLIGSGSSPVASQGTYEFRLEYDTVWANASQPSGDNRIRLAFFSAGADVLTASPLFSLDDGRGGAFSSDAFGIFQPGIGNVESPTYSVVLSNLTYTGMTAVAVAEPSSCVLITIGGLLMASRRRRR
jgi:hypothetical protein